MISAQTKIDQIIFHIYKKEIHLPNTHLSQKIEDLVDIIKIRSVKNGFEKTSKSLYPELFEIRLGLVEHIYLNKDFWDEYETLLLEEISDKYFNKQKFQKLSDLYIDCLTVYHDILQKIKDSIQDSVNQLFSQNAEIELPSWNAYKLSLLQTPMQNTKSLVNWMEASLDFEYAFIATVFVLNEDLKIKEDLANDLRLFLQNAIINYAAYSSYLGFWKPNSTTESQLERNIKIKASAFVIEAGEGKRYSTQGMDLLFSN